MKRISVLGFCFALTNLLIFSPSANAAVTQPVRVVVMPISGPDGAKVTPIVTDLVQSSFELVPVEAFTEAFSRLGATSDSADLVRVAKDINAQAIITGITRKKRGKNFKLELTIREGKSGNEANKLEVDYLATRRDKAIRDQLAGPLSSALEALRPPPVKIDVETPGELTMKKPAPPTKRKVPPKPELTPRFVLRTGLTFIKRSFNFENSTTTANLPSYSGASSPAVLFEAEAFPLAKRRGALSGIGVATSFELVPSMKSSDPDAGKDSIPTRRVRWEIDARYRYRFGKYAQSPAIWTRVGFGLHRFTIDNYDVDNDNMSDRQLPNVAYQYLVLALGGSAGLGRRITVSADFGLYRPSSVGEISHDDWYGGASVGGLFGNLAVDAAIAGRFGVRAAATYTRFFYDFDGSGVRTDQDGNMAQDVGGAVDKFFGVIVAATMKLQ